MMLVSLFASWFLFPLTFILSCLPILTVCANQRPIMSVLQYVIKVLCVIHLVIRGSDAENRDANFVQSRLEYMGNYFAGHGQFPWVVDIRTLTSENQSEQYDWFIGNLIGPRYVLTTCDAVAVFDVIEIDRSRFVVRTKRARDYKVMYSPDFPYHGPRWYINRFGEWTSHSRELKTGTRQISRMTPHPFCNPQHFRFFWGMVELGIEPIKPFRLFVNYAPGDLDANSLNRKWHQLQETSAWNPALLSTWGRHYTDKYQPTMLLNFKLKYQIRFQQWNVCRRERLRLSWSRFNTDMIAENNTFCMQVSDVPNTLVSVCEHDRGAPVVWEDYLIGIVVSAAKAEHCSLINPLPFVVHSLEDAEVYWTNVERHILQYFIDNSSHVFPGLTGLVVHSDGRSIFQPEPTTTAIAWTIVGLLMLLLSAII
uniref:Uncharacterized protein n=1 Tax=Lygus hesperus TaxID=30085 RepID=A0A0A9YDY4_LYGHE